MSKKLSILEAIRGGAALYVFLGHFMIQYIAKEYNLNSFLFIFRFGQEAVILFFLISGFVIQFSYAKKRISFGDFFSKRFFRIYPLFIVSILLVVFFKITEGLPLDIKTLIGNIFMLQDISSLKPGTIVATYGNSPLWSLSYEWWFYMLFIAISSFKNINSVSFIIVLTSSFLYFFYPIQIFRWLMYFGIWWSGVMLANFYLNQNFNFKNIIFFIILPNLILPISFLTFKAFTTPFNTIGSYPILEIRHFTSAIFFILTAFIWKKIHWIGQNIFKPLQRIAPFSYGLYVLHLPLIMILELFFTNIYIGFFKFVIIGSLVILISFLFEIKIQKIILKK